MKRLGSFLLFFCTTFVNNMEEEKRAVEYEQVPTTKGAVEYEQVPTTGSVPIPPSSNSGSLPQSHSHSHSHFISKIGSKCLDFLFSKQFAKLLEKLTKNFYFWFIYLLCTLAEPILCAYYPTTTIWILQIFFLVLNTCFFFIEIYGTVRTLRENWKTADSADEANQIVTDNSNHEPDDSFLIFLRRISSAVKSNFWARFLFHCIYKSHGEHALSFLCLLGGWIFIFSMPGVAILRCFRVFRMLWLYEKKLDGNFQRYLDKIHDAIGKDIIDANYFAILGDLCEFSIKSLTALGSEMFRLTSKTRGGLFLMLVFFYFSYLFGAMYYVETVGNDWNQVCTSVGQCMYVMMRLAFFDGTGLDYANDLGQNERPILFFMSMVYLAICAFGLLNGLIGIFGTTFRFASRDAFKKGGKRTRPPAPTPTTLDVGDSTADIGNGRVSLHRQHSPTPSVFTDFLRGEIFDEPELMLGRPHPMRTVSSPREFLRREADTVTRPTLQRSSSAPVTATIYPGADDQLSSGSNPAAESFHARSASQQQQGEGSTHELHLSSIHIAATGDGDGDGDEETAAGEGQEQGDSVAIRQLQDEVKELKRNMARIVALLELIADNADIDDAFS